MKILVDHGSSHNLGDTAMLEGAVGRLVRGAGERTACIVDRPGLRTRLWDWPGVERAAVRLPLPGPGPRALYRIPYLWRHAQSLGRRSHDLAARGCLAVLERTLRARDVRVDDGDAGTTLGPWCEGFDGLLVVGGGNLTDTFPGELWQRCCLIHTFASQGKPVVLTGQQIGPWRSRLTSRALARAARRADFLGLREPTASVDFCRRAGLPGDSFAVMGDDSFGLEAAGPDRVGPLLGRHGLRPGEFLAVNVRIASYAASHGESLRRMAALATGLERRYGLPAVVVPIALNEGDSDVAAGHRLAEAAGDGSIHVMDEPDLTSALVKGVLGQARAAVGVSYHFCTFALSQGVPAVCLHQGDYYTQKGIGLSRFWGDQRLSLPLGQGGAVRDLDRVADLIDDRPFREALARRAAEAVEHWGAVFDARTRASFARHRDRIPCS